MIIITSIYLFTKRPSIMMSKPSPEDVVKALLPKLVQVVDPVVILPHLQCIAPARKETIQCEQRNYGKQIAVQSLVSYMTGRDNWFSQFCTALKNPDVDCVSLAETLEMAVRRGSLKDSTHNNSRRLTRDTPIREMKGSVRKAFKRLQLNTLENWQTFADKAGYTVDDISQFESKPSPAIALFIEWSTRKEATIGKLVQILREMERDDILDELKKTDAREVVQRIERQLGNKVQNNTVLSLQNKGSAECTKSNATSKSLRLPPDCRSRNVHHHPERHKTSTVKTADSTTMLKSLIAEGYVQQSMNTDGNTGNVERQPLDCQPAEIVNAFHQHEIAVPAIGSPLPEAEESHRSSCRNQFFYESTGSVIKSFPALSEEHLRLKQTDTVVMECAQNTDDRPGTKNIELDSAFFRNKRQIISKIEQKLDAFDATGLCDKAHAQPSLDMRRVVHPGREPFQIGRNGLAQDQVKPSQDFIDIRQGQFMRVVNVDEREPNDTVHHVEYTTGSYKILAHYIRQPASESATVTPPNDNITKPSDSTEEIELFISDASTLSDSLIRVACPYLSTFLQGRTSIGDIEQKFITLAEGRTNNVHKAMIGNTSSSNKDNGLSTAKCKRVSANADNEILTTSHNDDIIGCGFQDDVESTPSLSESSLLLTIKDAELPTCVDTKLASALDNSRVSYKRKCAELIMPAATLGSPLSELSNCSSSSGTASVRQLKKKPVTFKGNNHFSETTKPGDPQASQLQPLEFPVDSVIARHPSTLIEDYSQPESFLRSSKGSLSPAFPSRCNLFGDEYAKDGCHHRTTVEGVNVMAVQTALSGDCMGCDADKDCETETSVKDKLKAGLAAVAKYCIIKTLQHLYT